MESQSHSFVAFALAVLGTSLTMCAQSLPTKLMECEAGQCAPAGGGGAIWTFNGQRGQARWRYGAVADLTIQRFDAKGVVIYRADPPGTYSGGLTAIYSGTIRGNRIDGNVTWTWPGHWNHSPTAKWYATVVEPAGYVFLDPNVPCTPDSRVSASDALARGLHAFQSKNTERGLCWFRVGARMGDADTQALLASALYTGAFGVPRNYFEARIWAQRAAAQNEYLGELCLARLYDEGKGLPADPEKAKYWREKAQRDKLVADEAEKRALDQRKQQKREIEAAQARRSQEQAMRNFAGLAILGLFLGAMGADAGVSGPSMSEFEQNRYLGYRHECEADHSSYACRNLAPADKPVDSPDQ